MPLVLSDERRVLRVDGDVLEIFIRGAFSERALLAWLAVQVHPLDRGLLQLRMASTSHDMPLYEPRHAAVRGVAEGEGHAGKRCSTEHAARGRAPLPGILHPGGTVVRSPRGAVTRFGHGRRRRSAENLRAAARPLRSQHVIAPG